MGFWQNEKIEKQAAEIARLERQIQNMDEMLLNQARTIKRLQEALEPFADMHDRWWAGGVMFLPIPDEHTVLVEFVHLRKAKEALK